MKTLILGPLAFVGLMGLYLVMVSLALLCGDDLRSANE